MASSLIDSRTVKPSSATFRTVQGTQIDDVQTSSNAAIPPTDSRSQGASVDSRVAANIPQNSRT